MRQVLLFLLGWIGISGNIVAQQYTVNGNATQNNCHCYTLTPAVGTQSGSVWNNIRIDLTQSFDFKFDVYLGCQDANGADGIVFMLQPISTSIGSSGGGLGFGGIAPSIGVTLDTYQNQSPDNDPYYDHIAIQANGDITHVNPANNLAGPVPISSTSDNVEDCNWHILQVKWDAVTHTYEAYFDGVLRVSIVKDLVADIFGGNPMVFWGFTGATGGLNNLQQFCTTLKPGIKSLAMQKRCVNEPVTFYDSTLSFAPVVKRYWDFGDGSNIDSVNLNPVHTYTTAGDYTVTLTVLGTDGCREVLTQPIRIGSFPTASFNYTDSCMVNPIQFFSTSTVQVGTVNQFYWDLGNGNTSSSFNPTTSYPSFGPQTIRLAVKTMEGCASDTLVRPIRIRERPTIDFTFTDSVCLGAPMQFFDNTVTSDGPVANWLWNIEGQAFNTEDLTYTFSTAGPHNVLHAGSITGSAGCLGVKTKTVFVINKPIAYFKGSQQVCQYLTLQPIDSSYTTDGIALQQWQWSSSNGQASTQQNPSFTYNTPGIDTLKLVVQNSRGCFSDTFKRVITIDERPIAKPGITSKLCENNLIQFADSSTVGGSSIASWSWLFSNSNTSTQKDPSQIFAAGPQLARLVVTSAAGCRSDTANRLFVVRAKPLLNAVFANGCVRDTIDFSATANTPITEWLWGFGDGATSTAADTAHVYTAANTYPVTLLAKDTAGCWSDTLKRGIIISGSNANAGADVIAALGQPVPLQATGGILYQWSPVAGLSAPDVANPIATPSQTTTYIVTAYTLQGCSSTDSVTVSIYKGPDIYVPNAFSPNGDGRNDVFRAIPVGVTRFESLSVFNRYGQRIFFSNNASQGWDGTWQGKKQNQDNYIWMVSGVDYRGERIFKKGSVLLVR